MQNHMHSSIPCPMLVKAASTIFGRYFPYTKKLSGLISSGGINFSLPCWNYKSRYYYIQVEKKTFLAHRLIQMQIKFILKSM